MEVIHRRGGKFIVEYLPAEMILLDTYVKRLQSDQVQSAADLLAALLCQQTDFIFEVLNGTDVVAIEQMRSRVPPVSEN
ncbi:hypothetical protein KAR91_35050 [Candidatus Pacearchaeota archaeon]|nr:hypothetical protein [Candidatus Pacearchaeota archaeon]